MSYLELLDLLDSLEIPVAYNHFDSAPTIPFITIVENEPTFIMADDYNYYKDQYFGIEYYFRHKDPEQEQLLETLLTSNRIPYTSTGDTWIADEKLYYKIYEVKI